MKISLNKANKLRNSVEGLDIKLTVNMSIRSDQGILDDDLSTYRKILSEQLVFIGQKYSVIYTMRNLIQSSNFRSGISSVIGEIAHIERIIKQYGESISQISRAGAPPEDTVAQLAFARTQAERGPEFAKPPTRYIVSAVPPGMHEEVQKHLLDAKLALEEAKERRNSLNNSEIIELPPEVVVFLRGFGLLKA